MDKINPLMNAVADKVAEAQALGISSMREIDLLAWLRDIGCLDARTESQAALYRVHFFMRNALYQLAREDQDYVWLFSAVGVEWVKPSLVGQSSTNLGQARDSSLEDYYTNMNNAALAEQEVDALLNDFWRRYQNYSEHLCGDISAALKTLELDGVESLAALKLQYRRLVMQAHPDRGGSKEKMQRLNSAFNKIKNSFAV